MKRYYTALHRKGLPLICGQAGGQEVLPVKKNIGTDKYMDAQHLPSSAQHFKRHAALYVHWPYCEKRCTYCNFNKYIKSNVEHSRMRKCLVSELQTLIHISGIQKINSVFFGGGTPSLAEPETMAAIIECLSKPGVLVDGAEVTMEANPTTFEASKLQSFKLAGINRVSIGIQSLHESDLQLLGRQHTVRDSLRCLKVARELFPGRVSVDLIFGRPCQTPDSWKSELIKLLSVCDDHVSLYQLTVERGTKLFKQVSAGDLNLPSPEYMADMYETAIQVMKEHGFSRYEVSNFCRNGARSSHNQAYWQGTPYLGIGPGAHGRFYPAAGSSREARVQTLEPDNWMWEVERNGHGTRRVTRQTDLEVLQEVLMLGLRTSEGICEQRWHLFCPDSSLMDVFGRDSYIEELTRQGFLDLSPEWLRATDKGLNVIDQITPQLINIIEEREQSKAEPAR